MIDQISGTVLSAGVTECVIELGGLGLHAFTTPDTAAGLRVGDKATLHTNLVVREDSLTLYAFASPQHRDAFVLVQSASGIGPKVALAIVSVLKPSDLRRAIESEDLAALVRVPGIGRKGAQKLVIELKDKAVLLGQSGPADTPGTPTSTDKGWREKVSEGLQSLGWSARDAEAACENVAHLAQADEDISIGALMRAALSTLAKR